MDKVLLTRQAQGPGGRAGRHGREIAHGYVGDSQLGSKWRSRRLGRSAPEVHQMRPREARSGSAWLSATAKTWKKETSARDTCSQTLPAPDLVAQPASPVLLAASPPPRSAPEQVSLRAHAKEPADSAAATFSKSARSASALSSAAWPGAFGRGLDKRPGFRRALANI